MQLSSERLSGQVPRPYAGSSSRFEPAMQWAGYHTWQDIKPKDVSACPELVCIHELHSEVLQPQLVRALAHAQAPLHQRSCSSSIAVVLKLPGSSIAPQPRGSRMQLKGLCQHLQTCMLESLLTVEQLHRQRC